MTTVTMVGVCGESGYFADYRYRDEARAAAWAWHDRRLAVHARVADDPRHRTDDVLRLRRASTGGRR